MRHRHKNPRDRMRSSEPGVACLILSSKNYHTASQNVACPKPATCLPLVTRVHYSTYLYNTNILICSGLKQQPAVATKSLQEIVSNCGNRNIHFGSFKVGNSWLGSTLFSFVGTGSPIAFFASLRVPCSTHTASYSTQIPRTESAQDVPPTS